MSASPSNVPSQFGAAELHPEFGYFAPTIRFRRKVALTLKGAALGVLVGAVTMFFMTIEREEQALTMLATPVLIAPAPSKPSQVAMPTRMAAAEIFPPVRFVPGSIALPVAVPTSPPLRGTISTDVAAAASAPAPLAPATVGVPPAASVVAAAPEPAPAPAAKAVAKPKKKIVRAPEPEPRSAFASPFRGFGLPIFDFGQ